MYIFYHRCPGCNRQTCCVACSKQHKVTYDCTGIRPKSSFLPLSSMSDDTLSQGIISISVPFL